MKRICFLSLAAFFFALLPIGEVGAEDEGEYPCLLLDAYNPDGDCWRGMGSQGWGDWPIGVKPEKWLVGPPPSEISGVSLPTDYWVELQFAGALGDAPGKKDIVLFERDPVGEAALAFITDGNDREYMFGAILVPITGGHGLTEVGFNFPDISLPFAARAIRIVGIDTAGGSPGFDLANIRARIFSDCGYAACNPCPADGAENVSTDAVLHWSPGQSAAKHTVYFGTSGADVDANATAVSNPPQPQDANSFDPGGLELGRTYYWRIDEVNDPCVWTGKIWSFRAAETIEVDDFELYNNSDNWIYNAWTDTGTSPVNADISTKTVHKCSQAMTFDYYFGKSFYTEVSLTFSPAQDWASARVKALELFFYGLAGNDTNGQMYVSLSDGIVRRGLPYNGDANDIEKEEWQLWRINLQDINDVNFSSIESISIGFRNEPAGEANWGMGTVYFDDIIVYPSRCLDENRPNADFNGDCVVDFEDAEELTSNWLDKGYRIYETAAPNAPLAWYKFDGNANDSSVNNYHGSLIGDANTAHHDPNRGLVLKLDGYGDSVNIRDAAELFGKISTGITICFWQKGEDSGHHTDTLCCSNVTYDVNGPARPVVNGPSVSINLGCWRQPGRYNWDCGHPWSFDNRLSGEHRYKREWTEQWNHWAFTKDTQAGVEPNIGVMQIFLNGALYESRTDANSPITGVSVFQIGSGWYGGYDGLLDDFQIYDYALSQKEIAYAATNGTGIFEHCLMTKADLFVDDEINFKDFALLGGKWLIDLLWP